MTRRLGLRRLGKKTTQVFAGPARRDADGAPDPLSFQWPFARSGASDWTCTVSLALPRNGMFQFCSIVWSSE